MYLLTCEVERRFCLSGVLSFNILSCNVELLSYISSFSGSDGISCSEKNNKPLAGVVPWIRGFPVFSEAVACNQAVLGKLETPWARCVN